MTQVKMASTGASRLEPRRRILFHRFVLVSVLLVIAAMLPGHVATAASTSLPGFWAPTQSMSTGRQAPTMTLLPNGLVLVAGGCSTNGIHIATAELYNHSTHTFVPTGSMTTPRCAQTATLLPDGQVLVAGGSTSNGPVLSSAELYNPNTGTWTPTGSMSTPRSSQIAALLPNGEVLVVGGTTDAVNGLSSAELYNPQTGTWTPTGSMQTGRFYFTGTLLRGGKVLVAGGLSTCASGCSATNTAEVYDPSTGTWASTGNLPTPLFQQAASRLLNGQVLVSGGSSIACPYACAPTANAELYNPSTGRWTLTIPMHAARESHTSTLLLNGQVLVAGGAGADGNALASAEVYDPVTGTWTQTGSMPTNRAFQSATLLPFGAVLVAGGCDVVNDSCTDAFNSAELYIPHDR